MYRHNTNNANAVFRCFLRTFNDGSGGETGTPVHTITAHASTVFPAVRIGFKSISNLYASAKQANELDDLEPAFTSTGDASFTHTLTTSETTGNFHSFTQTMDLSSLENGDTYMVAIQMKGGFQGSSMSQHGTTYSRVLRMLGVMMTATGA